MGLSEKRARVKIAELMARADSLRQRHSNEIDLLDKAYQQLNLIRSNINQRGTVEEAETAQLAIIGTDIVLSSWRQQ